MIDKFITIILLTIPFLGIIILFSILYRRSFFNYDKNNPYRRYCKRCGQQQDVYTSSYASNYFWWEDRYPVRNETCRCHKYSK